TLAALQLDLLGLATGTGSEQYRRRGGPHSHMRAPTTPHDPARRAHHPCTPPPNTPRPYRPPAAARSIPRVPRLERRDFPRLPLACSPGWPPQSRQTPVTRTFPSPAPG